MTILALVQLIVFVGVRRAFQPLPPEKKRWLATTALQCSQTTTAITNIHQRKMCALVG